MLVGSNSWFFIHSITILKWVSCICIDGFGIVSVFYLVLGRDNFILLHGLMAAMACYTLPFLTTLPLWNWKGCIYALILHMGVSEPLYYWIHKRLHNGYLFTHYHSLHHASAVLQSFTGIDQQIPTLSFSEHVCMRQFFPQQFIFHGKWKL